MIHNEMCELVAPPLPAVGPVRVGAAEGEEEIDSPCPSQAINCSLLLLAGVDGSKAIPVVFLVLNYSILMSVVI